jgi:phosphorylcholine metabolism protein LicD
MAGHKKLIGKRREDAYKMLHKVCAILDEEAIPYVLEAGTLLGVVREDRLLPWDNDLDITISAVYAEKLLKIRHRFRVAGYRSRLRKYKCDIGPIQQGMPRILKIQTRKFGFLKKDSLLDIFIKYKEGEQYLWIVDDKHPVLKKCPAAYYDKRTSYPFDGKTFQVPEKYTEYLAYHYGSNWQTPIKEWDFRLDDSCEKETIVLPGKSSSFFKPLKKKLNLWKFSI